MSKQRIRFILNPVAGKSKKNDLRKLIAQFIDGDRFDYDIRVSEYAGHAGVLVQEAVDQAYDVVAVAGGDGSINEVGTKLIGTDIALGVIPLGSGNGLSR